jgi:phosphate starvation-inducible protein PhoH and related proteins
MSRPKKSKKSKNRKSLNNGTIQNQIQNQPREIKQAKQLKPKTKNQAEFIRTISENTVSMGVGPAGCGKTLIAVAYGIEKLLIGEYKSLIITRPVVEAGENLGFLPGDFSQKLDPYLQPIYYELSKYISKQELQTFINNGVNRVGKNEIIIAPLAYMRGMNYHNSYMILDECQNCTHSQIKLFVTRVGFNSKAILVGDDKQTDLYEGESGLPYWYNKLTGIESVGTFRFDNSDIIRNPVISRILAKIGE